MKTKVPVVARGLVTPARAPLPLTRWMVGMSMGMIVFVVLGAGVAATMGRAQPMRMAGRRPVMMCGRGHAADAEHHHGSDGGPRDGGCDAMRLIGPAQAVAHAASAKVNAHQRVPMVSMVRSQFVAFVSRCPRRGRRTAVEDGAVPCPSMAAVQICFADGEILYAEVDDLSFDAPVLEAQVRNVDANSDWALLPCTAIQHMLVGDPEPLPESDTLSTWERAVFRFRDGAVLRALIAPEAKLGRHGGVWRCLGEDDDEVRRLAIPYAALKAVFRVRTWDSRPRAERCADGFEAQQLEQLAQILAERSTIQNEPPADRPVLLERVRSAGRRRPLR